ncbi:hypothetical protein HUT18_13760 [Streptomyces sp. NA04227]|uniref:hypothetical protein n=1 Tax=Streptomyces sp. NA04227 TaxID=2742136 RepID=UPI0015929AFD|nr:hypothetical protein [Streptomyces sp. NA04227]QKW07299.1 hypothetical protein HUT18_13760 [Streptomyces sp. NA04227]
MTSATSVLRRVRMAAAVLPVAAALVLTGCSSDSDDSKDKDNAKPSAESSAPADDESATPDSGDSGTGNGKGLEGSWLSTKGGNAVALVVNQGKAGLFSSGGSVCSGTAGEKAGMQMVELKCTDGNTDRNEGHVKSVDAKTLTVSWEGFGDETFQRTEGTDLPSGMPTPAPPAS